MMKVLNFLALVGFVSVAAAADLNEGVSGGRIIFEQNVTASPTLWKQTQSFTVNATSDEVISQIVVIDNRPDKDGDAKVIEGGAGQKNVTIELKSPTILRGFDFSIKVYAAPENVNNGPAPNHPKPTGVETQNPQVPHSNDFDVNNKQEPKNEDDIILGAPTPTASSTTEVNNNQEKTNNPNPALVGKEQPRLNRDTEGQNTKEQTPTPTPAAVDALKEVKVNDENFMDAIFGSNSSQKTEDAAKGPAHPVVPEEDDEDLTTAKSVGQDKVPRVVPVASEGSSTPSADKVTTETPTISSKLPEYIRTTEDLERNLKGQHFGHHHAVPLPYVN